MPEEPDEAQTYNDDLLDDKARKVVNTGLDILDVQLMAMKNGQSYSSDKTEAASQAVNAALGAMKAETDDDNS